MAAIPVQSSNCRYDDCTCPKYSVHRFKFTLSCIDCGHLADFHDANAEEVEANFSLAHTLIIQPLESPLDFEKRRGKLERKPSGSNEWEGNEREDDDDDGVRSQVGSSDFIRPMITEAVVEHQPFLQAPKDFSQFASMTMIQQVEDIYSDVADPSLFVTKRDHIIRELFTTEQTYVTSLTFLINEYKVVMQEDAILEKECPRIFLSLPEILFTNKTLLHKLHSKVMHWSSDLTIGDDLVCLFPYMRMYKMYCSAYESAAKRVQDLLQSNAAFVQLNEDLVKHTPIEHPDYIGVCEAMNKFRQLAMEVNEGIRDSENRAITIEIQNQFSPPIQIVASHRSLILKGSVTKVGRSVKLRRHLFLFSDLFLNAKGSQEKGYQMNHMASIDNLLFVPSLRYQERSFGIRTETRSYTLICDTEVDYKAWIEAFRRALQIARSRSTIMRPTSTQPKEVYFAPLWQPDDTTDICMSCSGKFTFMTRKHHCRVCGLVVCNSCSPNRVHIQGSSERVCSKCKESHLPK